MCARCVWRVVVALVRYLRALCVIALRERGVVVRWCGWCVCVCARVGLVRPCCVIVVLCVSCLLGARCVVL